MANIYLNRYAWSGPILESIPANNTQIIVVIPCYNEPNILDALESLDQCKKPVCKTEVIVVVNQGEDEAETIKAANLRAVEAIKEWTKNRNDGYISWEVIAAYDLPTKQAGVGLARKIGMDEAARRFEAIDNKRGIIVCFDADCGCTANYLEDIYDFYQLNQSAQCATVCFEHPLTGPLAEEVYHSIVDYELHLRYYKNALAVAGFPYAFHTVGSCITVRADSYQRIGGMNKRKAGEDFYFLQKMYQLGEVHTIGRATVFPSPRPSDRVPFGTGRAITNMLKHPGKSGYFTYNPQTFKDFKVFVQSVQFLYDKNITSDLIETWPASLKGFLSSIQFEVQVEKIRKNCRDVAQFQRSFFHWFNGFLALKYVHFARDNFYEDMEINEASNWILKELSLLAEESTNKLLMLEMLRKWDRSH